MQILLVSTKKQILKHLNDILDNKATQCSKLSDINTAIDEAATKGAIVCLDVSNVGKDSLALVKQILAKHEELKILALSQEPSLDEGSKFLEAGVKGYVNSRLYDTHLKDALETISNGNAWVYPEFIYSMVKLVAKKSNAKNDVFNELTQREKEIAGFVLEGLSNKEVAEKTDVSERTVKAHLSNIYSKFGVKDRVGFVLAMENK